MLTSHQAKRRRWAMLAASVLLLVSVQPALAARELDPLVLGKALEYRRTFGFSTDLAYVTSVELNITASRKYSVALNAEETADMERRMSIQEALVPVAEYGRARPDVFGGMFVDQARGGIVYMDFTADVAVHEAAIRRLAPAAAEVHVRQVAWTETALEALVERVARDEEFHASLGITVHETSTNTPDNVVDVQIEPFSEEAANAIRERYGPAVRAIPGTAPELTACVNRDNCVGPPIMAGVSNDWGCTVGFGIWMDGNRRFLTAGHCVQQVVDAYGWAGWIWYHQNVSLGYSTDESWYDWSFADAGAMGNVSSSVHSNRVLYTTQPSWFGMHSVQTSGADWVGMAICQSGQTTGYSCGTIQSRTATPNYGGVHIQLQRRASYFVQNGDSGAPVISQSNTNLAVGLQSGMDGPYIPYYSHIAYVLAPNGPTGGIGAALWTYDS